MSNSVHEVTRDDQGNQIGTDGRITVSLLGEGRMFKRRGIKNFGSGLASEVCWLVAELDGVRVYQEGNNVIVTKEDLYP